MLLRLCLFFGLVLLALTIPVPGAERYDLLVQGAMDMELQPLLNALENKQEHRLAAWTFWTGRIRSQTIVLSRTEIGPINAVAATVLGIEHFHPRTIINQGTAGAHNPDLKLWDIVVGERTVDHSGYKSDHGDEGTGTRPGERWKSQSHDLRLDNETFTHYATGFPGDPALIVAALGAKNPRGRVMKGVIGSAYQFNREIDHIRWLRQAYGTDTEDMESVFAAGAAAGFKVPFVAIRMVSDSEFSHPIFERIAGQYCAEFVLDLIRSGRLLAGEPAENKARAGTPGRAAVQTAPPSAAGATPTIRKYR